MPLSVTSWFVQQCTEDAPPVKRTFTIGTSDYSSFVTRWPKVSAAWDDARPRSVNMEMTNVAGTFLFIRDTPTTMTNSCSLKFGFTHPASGDELVTMFSGRIDKVSYRGDGRCTLTLIDKTHQLANRIIGSTTAPVVWSGATQLPSDIAWWSVTSYGGFSSVKSSSNPDIDYTSFAAWAAVFSADTVYMHGRFTGQKVTEILRSISRHTASAIYMNQGKLTFQRFLTPNTTAVSIDDTYVLDSSSTIDDDDMVNKSYVFAGYAPNSNYWTITTFSANTSSVNSYGLHERIEKDSTIWYVSSAHARNMAERVLFTSARPYEKYEVTTQLAPMIAMIGETLQTEDNFLGVSGAWRVMRKEVNLETGELQMSIDASQLSNGFYLDVTSLDGTEVLL